MGDSCRPILNIVFSITEHHVLERQHLGNVIHINWKPMMYTHLFVCQIMYALSLRVSLFDVTVWC